MLRHAIATTPPSHPRWLIRDTQGRARQLYTAGFESLADLATADPDILTGAIPNLYRRQALALINGAKRLLRKQAEELLLDAEPMDSMLP